MKTIVNGQITLHSYIDPSTRQRCFVNAVLPPGMVDDWEGQSVNVIDWRIDNGQVAHLEYQTRQDPLAPILDATLPVVVNRIDIKPPTRSKHWEWSEFSEAWFNRKTGERVRA